MNSIKEKWLPVGVWLGLSLIFVTPCMKAVPQDDRENLSYAESQHEVVMALIKEGKYDEIFPEVQKICNLKFSDKNEDRLAKSIYTISDRLLHKDQTDLSLQILDEGLRSVNAKRNKALLYKRKGYVYRKLGDNKKAEEMFRKAAELESR